MQEIVERGRQAGRQGKGKGRARGSSVGRHFFVSFFPNFDKSEVGGRGGAGRGVGGELLVIS